VPVLNSLLTFFRAITPRLYVVSVIASNIGFIVLGSDLKTFADDGNDSLGERLKNRAALLGFKTDMVMANQADGWGAQVDGIEGLYGQLRQVMSAIVASADSSTAGSEGRRMAQVKEADRWTTGFLHDASLLAIEPEFAHTQISDVPLAMRQFLPPEFDTLGRLEISEEGQADPESIRPSGEIYKKSVMFMTAKLMAWIEQEGGGLLE